MAINQTGILPDIMADAQRIGGFDASAISDAPPTKPDALTKLPSTREPTGLLYAGGTPDFRESTGMRTAMPSAAPTPAAPTPAAPTSPTMLNPADLTKRTVDKPTETVSGNLDSLLNSDSPYLKSARASAAQFANSRGLLNSTMAATAGEKAAIDAALPIAQADAGVYGKATDYNTALDNQTQMYNADTANSASKQQVAIEADKATAAAQQSSQMSIAQLQAETSKYAADKTAGTATANARMSLINNVLMTTELSPDRKAALLKEMGEPGYAAAVYVVDTTAADLLTPEYVAAREAAYESMRSHGGSVGVRPIRDQYGNATGWEIDR